MVSRSSASNEALCARRRAIERRLLSERKIGRKYTFVAPADLRARLSPIDEQELIEEAP